VIRETGGGCSETALGGSNFKATHPPSNMKELELTLSQQALIAPPSTLTFPLPHKQHIHNNPPLRNMIDFDSDILEHPFYKLAGDFATKVLIVLVHLSRIVKVLFGASTEVNLTHNLVLLLLTYYCCPVFGCLWKVCYGCGNVRCDDAEIMPMSGRHTNAQFYTSKFPMLFPSTRKRVTVGELGSFLTK